MAIMIPEIPREYDPASMEGAMFDALRNLPDSYYVIHSFKNVFVKDNMLYEGETDFVIFSPKLGMLCIEAKAGQVTYRDGNWKYSNEKIMKHGGPYNQAANNKWSLLDTINNSSLSSITRRCKLLHAVWFPTIDERELNRIPFPAEADKRITMTMEALSYPEKYIERIFNINLTNNIRTNLSDSDVKFLIENILCPKFSVFPEAGLNNKLKKNVFHRLLKEQENILNFLVEQRTAVINGAAGTGKTMIAAEKARRHSAHKEKVLFLCYNAYLKDYLEKNNYNEYIDYYTIAGLVCRLCNTKIPNYDLAKEKIEDMYLMNTFPYSHVIVDEGQDFGRDDIEESDILQIMHDIIMDKDDNSSFYIFYDKLQLVQSKHIPKYISEADCKLTLYRNCRNTENIAITSMKPITRRKPKLYEEAVTGRPATIHFGTTNISIIEKIKMLIADLKENEISDIVILTCQTEEKSILNYIYKDGKYGKKKFTTCRKFKGLEADAVILIDVDKETFSEEQRQLYYVGASRARLRLDILTQMTDEDCETVLKETLRYDKKIKNPKRDLANALNSLANIISE